MTDDTKEKYFSKEKQELAQKWLNDKWKNRTCECCGRNTWTLAEDLVMPMTFTGGGLVLGGPTYPQIMVICTNCGNSKTFNAILAKVIPENPKIDGGNDEKAKT